MYSKTYSFKYNQQDATLYNILYYVNSLHVSGGFSTHHQKVKKCAHGIGYMSSLLAATASVGELELTHTSGSSMFQAVSPPIIRSSKTVHMASGICQACLLLLLVRVSWTSPTLAVAASKTDIYPMPCAQFFSS